MILVILFSLLLLQNKVSCVPVSYEPWNFNGTTPSLEIIFRGRCSQYQELNPDNRLPSLTENINCTDVWNIFSKVFEYKEQCKTKIVEKDYDEYFEKVSNKKKLVNKAMFWSGTREIVHDFSFVNTDYFTLEDTFPGYVANALNWCGCSTCQDGLNFQYCNKSCSQINPHWDGASRNFARSAAGIAYVMVNSTQAEPFTAYWNGSTFGRIELPTLGKEKLVKHLEVYLVSDIDKKPRERCGEGSLVNLVEDAKKYGITINCIQDPKMVESLLCAKYPKSEQCKREAKKVSDNWKTVSIALIVICGLFFVLLLILTIKIIRFTSKKT